MDNLLKQESASLSGLTTIKKYSVKDQTLAQLKNYILSGQVSLGERLPSERALAETLGVGRYSVREALKVLEAVGLVESRVGEGTFLTTNTGNSFGQILGLSLASWGGTIMEILDARKMIEVEATRAATKRANKEEIAKIKYELDIMATSTDEFPVYFEADMNFHRHIADASHNPIISQFVNNLLDLLSEVLKETQSDTLPTQAENTGTHQAIYDAIVDRNSDLAGELMREHIQFTGEVWQTIISLSTDSNKA